MKSEQTRAVDDFELLMKAWIKELNSTEEKLLNNVISTCCWFAKGLQYGPELYLEMIEQIKGKGLREGED